MQRCADARDRVECLLAEIELIAADEAVTAATRLWKAAQDLAGARAARPRAGEMTQPEVNAALNAAVNEWLGAQANFKTAARHSLHPAEPPKRGGFIDWLHDGFIGPNPPTIA